MVTTNYNGNYYVIVSCNVTQGVAEDERAGSQGNDLVREKDEETSS